MSESSPTTHNSVWWEGREEGKGEEEQLNMKKKMKHNNRREKKEKKLPSPENSAPPIYATQTLNSEAFLAHLESLLRVFLLLSLNKLFSLLVVLCGICLPHLYRCEDEQQQQQQITNESWGVAV